MLTNWVCLPVGDWRDMLQQRILCNTLEVEKSSIEKHGTYKHGR